MNSQTSISTDIIINKVYTIRGQQVMLYFDAAEQYEVDRKTLLRSVKETTNVSRQIFCTSLPNKSGPV